MHLFGGSCDGIHRTGLNAQGAAYAGAFVDDGKGFCFGNRVFTERLELHAQQFGQFPDALLATRRAAVDVGFPRRDGRGIRLASRVAALPALGLRQDVVDLVHQRIAFGMEFDRGEAQHRAKHGSDG